MRPISVGHLFYVIFARKTVTSATIVIILGCIVLESFFQDILQIIDYQCKGVGNRLNNNLFFDLVENSDCDFCFVQETLVSSDATIKALSCRWLGRSFWSPAIGKQGGVALLVSPKFSDPIMP